MENLIAPHGGHLCDLLASDAAALKTVADGLPSLTLSRRQLCDLELLMTGALSPLCGYMTQATYRSVVEDMRLADGTLWPMPIVLDVTAAVAATITPNQPLALRDAEGVTLAVLNVEELWQPDKTREAERVYGTDSPQHPGVRELYEQVHEVYVGGTVTGLQLPAHHEFTALWLTPQALRQQFAVREWRRVVGFHTRRPLHRREFEITRELAQELSARLLLHPAIGPARPGESIHITRIRCYRAIMHRYPADAAMLALVPLATRMAGPREALWHALIRQNYGCTDFIVGPAHADPIHGTDKDKSFYPRYAAQELLQIFSNELRIGVVPLRERRYAERRARFMTTDECAQAGEIALDIADDELRALLARNADIPLWYSYPEVIDVLRKTWPPRTQQGIVLFFTGLSGAGKSTLANIIYAKLIEHGSRPVTLLDGDIVRSLSGELGFSKSDRDLNVRRIAFVANEIAKNGGVAICAPIAPYAAARQAARELIEIHSAFIEIYVSTPLAVCETRDRKGLYAKARQGLIANFTGVSDPYEIPATPELHIDTAGVSPADAAEDIFRYLVREGYLV